MNKSGANPFRVTYDTESDAAYIYLQDIPPGGVARTIPIEVTRGYVNVDFDAEDRMVGIEILGARAVLPEGFVL